MRRFLGDFFLFFRGEGQALAAQAVEFLASVA